MDVSIIYVDEISHKQQRMTGVDLVACEIVSRYFVYEGSVRLPDGSRIRQTFLSCNIETVGSSVRYLVGRFEIQLHAPGYTRRAAILTLSRYFESSNSPFNFSIDGNKTFLDKPLQLFDKMLEDVVENNIEDHEKKVAQGH